MERAGIPTVLITAMPNVARNIGTPRILQGVAIKHPTGDPQRSLEGEEQLRRNLITAAVRIARTEVEGPTIFS